MKALKPTFSPRLQSSTAVQRAPLWLMKPTLPGASHRAGKGSVEAGQRTHHAEAVRPDNAQVPSTRLFQDLLLHLGTCCAAFLETSRDDNGPFDPSLDTLGNNTGTVGAGVTMTARSTCWGRAARLGYALMPRTLAR